MKRRISLFVCFVLGWLASCKYDSMPEPVQPVPAPVQNTDPRDVYAGNYHFTVIYTNWTQMSQTTTVDTVLYDGRIYTDTASPDSIYVVYSQWDCVRVAPDSGGHFFIGLYPGSAGLIDTLGNIDMDFTYSQSASHNFHRNVHGVRF